MEVRRATEGRSSRATTRAIDEPPASGWGRIVALVAAAVSVAAAWLGFPGLVFHVSSSLREWLMPLVQ